MRRTGARFRGGRGWGLWPHDAPVSEPPLSLVPEVALFATTMLWSKTLFELATAPAPVQFGACNSRLVPLPLATMLLVTVLFQPEWMSMPPTLWFSTLP